MTQRMNRVRALRYATGVVSSISGRPRKPSSVSPNVKTRSQRVTCSGVASRPTGVLYTVQDRSVYNVLVVRS